MNKYVFKKRVCVFVLIYLVLEIYFFTLHDYCFICFNFFMTYESSLLTQMVLAEAAFLESFFLESDFLLLVW